MSVCMLACACVPIFVAAIYQIPRIVMGVNSTLTALRKHEFFHLLVRLQRTYRHTENTRTRRATHRDKNLNINAPSMALAESLVPPTP